MKQDHPIVFFFVIYFAIYMVLFLCYAGVLILGKCWNVHIVMASCYQCNIQCNMLGMLYAMIDVVSDVW